MSSSRFSAIRPWLVFVGCCVLSLVGFGMIINTPGLYYAVLSQELHVSRAQVALATTIMNGVGALTMVVGGRAMKRFDSRILISVCVAVCAIVFFAGSYFTALWQFYVAFVILGVAYVIPVSLAPSVLLSNWFEQKVGMVMGIALGLSGVGGMVFNPVVSSWISDFGWRTSYRFTALVLAVCILPFSLLVLKFLPDESRGEFAYGHSTVATDASYVAGDEASKDGNMNGGDKDLEAKADDSSITGVAAHDAYRTVTFMLLAVISVMLQFTSGLVQHVSGYEQTRGLNLQQGALVVSGIMLGAAVGKATIGILLDRLNTQLVLVLYSVVGLAGWLMMMLVKVPGLATVAGLLAGLGQGVVLVAVPWLVRRCFGRRNYAEIFSGVQVAGTMALALSATVHGAVFDFTGSYLPSLASAVIFFAIAAFGLSAAFRLRPRFENAAEPVADGR
ncbi:MFS transporter [Bifidobacterium sp. ESL0682]|uniref:MFS transporter n=1 Tax=Bifidobacterium sp. ESL0682 TaxID=2983212 RepID=UPI0023F94FF9|nr:MFS transporter [Bifidobacterium sp. ESL0682]WEV42263.1 MFS transporter [Bifidobacterium sp. ESL0682]